MMMQLKSRVLVDAMREEDIAQIQLIEKEIFPTPWPATPITGSFITTAPPTPWSCGGTRRSSATPASGR